MLQQQHQRYITNKQSSLATTPSSSSSSSNLTTGPTSIAPVSASSLLYQNGGGGVSSERHSIGNGVDGVGAALLLQHQLPGVSMVGQQQHAGSWSSLVNCGGNGGDPHCLNNISTNTYEPNSSGVNHSINALHLVCVFMLILLVVCIRNGFHCLYLRKTTSFLRKLR